MIESTTMLTRGRNASLMFFTTYFPPSEPKSAYTTQVNAGIIHSFAIIAPRRLLTARISTKTAMISVVTRVLTATESVATTSFSSVPILVSQISCALTTHGIFRFDRLPVMKARYALLVPSMGE